jgi:hypothetical protein
MLHNLLNLALFTFATTTAFMLLLLWFDHPSNQLEAA